MFTALRAKSSILQVEACCRDERAKRACLRFIAELTEGTTDSIKEEKRSAACLQIGPIFTDVLSEWVRRGGGEGRGGGGALLNDTFCSQILPEAASIKEAHSIGLTDDM